MRIIGGRHRGLMLAEIGAGDPRARLRPTSDRVRESLFNLLAHGDYGHPAPELLAALTAAGARVWRTDLSGDVVVVAEEGEVGVVTRD